MCQIGTQLNSPHIINKVPLNGLYLAESKFGANKSMKQAKQVAYIKPKYKFLQSKNIIEIRK